MDALASLRDDMDDNDLIEPLTKAIVVLMSIADNAEWIKKLLDIICYEEVAEEIEKPAENKDASDTENATDKTMGTLDECCRRKCWRR